MRELLLASVRAYARRYVAAAVAVVVGVGFIVTTDALASSARNGLTADVSASYAGAEQVLTGFADVAQGARAVRLAEEAGVPATLNAMTVADLTVDGASSTEPVTLAAQSADPAMRWQELIRGRFATGPGEAVMDVYAAKAEGVGIGEVLVLHQDSASRSVTVTGLVDPASLRSAEVYLTAPDLVALDTPTLLVEAVLGGDPEAARTVAERVADGLPDGVTALSAEQHVVNLQTDLLQGVDVMRLMLLTFAAIALFVAVMVIANTFAVLLAQRQHEFALLRCVGATRRQLLRSVSLEALLLGAAAATVGVLGGIVAGRGLTALAADLFSSTLAVGEVEHSALWVGGAWLTGVVLTVLASLLPARRSTRTTPLAALRPEIAPTARNRAGVLRIVSGVLVAVPGVALLAVAMDRHELVLMLAGGFISFLGVLLLGPLLVPGMLRVVGAVVGRLLGVPGALAASNAVRHPRRTAATAAALLVGVTLITGMVVGMATVRTTVEAEKDREYPVDATLTTQAPLGEGVAARVRSVDGVADVVAVPGAAARLSTADQAAGPVVLLAPGLAAGDVTDVVHGRQPFTGVEPGTVVLPWARLAQLQLEPGDPVTVRVADTQRRLEARGGEGFGDAAVVAPSTLQRLTGGVERAHALWVLAEDGADPGDTLGALTVVSRSAGATLASGLADRDFIDVQLDVMLGAVLALLAISVAIALVGVGSTLGLSVLERTREHALLRALGLTRRQLRRTLAVEAVLLAAVAGVLGVALGLGYAWVGVRTMIGGVIEEVTFVVPAGQLAAVVAVAALAGLLAGVLPARRAARIAPASGLTAD